MCNCKKLSLSKFHPHRVHWTWAGGGGGELGSVNWSPTAKGATEPGWLSTVWGVHGVAGGAGGTDGGA